MSVSTALGYYRRPYTSHSKIPVATPTCTRIDGGGGVGIRRPPSILQCVPPVRCTIPKFILLAMTKGPTGACIYIPGTVHMRMYIQGRYQNNPPPLTMHYETTNKSNAPKTCSSRNEVHHGTRCAGIRFCHWTWVRGTPASVSAQLSIVSSCYNAGITIERCLSISPSHDVGTHVLVVSLENFEAT